MKDEGYKVPEEIAKRYPYTLPPAPVVGPHPIRHDENGVEIVLLRTPYTGPSQRVAKRRASRGRPVRRY